VSRLPFPGRGLYALTSIPCAEHRDLPSAVEQAILGGASVVQYRDKGHDPSIRSDMAARLLPVCHRHRVPLIINDDVELALRSGADGVHLGREDGDPRAARARLGEDAIIGVSCYNDLAIAVRAERDGADYVAFGSFYPSATKPAAVRATADLLRQARAQLRTPIVAIGGITPDNGAPLLAAGADLLAVINGLFDNDDIEAAARRYAAMF